ncbi:hypothetical protein [Winogradskyella sp.]|uniref:hypothetical protein n=1 Tax=Winogradskyella sp. TaxID=1883156 RepID=UPI002612A623|nr:hypothetical protein [Winogradskyella sp.]
MESFHLFVEVKIKENFSFLKQKHDFSAFTNYQIKDEYYINCRKDNIEFSVYIPMYSRCCPSISIIYHTNTKSNNFKRYDVENLTTKSSIRKGIGSVNIENYIIKCANILKENEQILYGKNEGYIEYNENNYNKNTSQ